MACYTNSIAQSRNQKKGWEHGVVCTIKKLRKVQTKLIQKSMEFYEFVNYAYLFRNTTMQVC